jgi:hypothetical protein
VVSSGNFNAEDHKRHIEAPLRQGLGDFPFIHLMKLDLGIRVFLAPIDEQAAERLSDWGHEDTETNTADLTGSASASATDVSPGCRV